MIYTNIKRVAKKKGIPMYIVERQAGLSAGSVNKWNVVSPTVRNLQKVADALGVDICELLGEEE